jgi:hypothetical protein
MLRLLKKKSHKTNKKIWCIIYIYIYKILPSFIKMHILPSCPNTERKYRKKGW